MIVGTAGHVDHGKTRLVRALTGVDTDRLEEEKARGISIELGYAYVPVDGATGRGDPVLGFVDVPGHERFVHTMAAGAGGIDFALLVVAADDGVMPQTLEHLAILDLLGVARAAVAITKVDRVDATRVREVADDVASALAATRLAGAPMFPLDATAPGDDGVAALRAHLHEAAAQAARHDSSGLFRLAVDRVFTLPGHGTVATGCVHAGRVRVGDALAILPRGTGVRVRGLYVQNRESDEGGAGQRCAINLAGVERDALSRGDWLADARSMRPSPRLDACLHLLPGAGTTVRGGTPLHVHLGTAHRVAQAVLLDAVRVSGGEAAHVQLVFDVPFCAAPGDRFIVRDAQAAHTIGGGVVLDPCAPERRRRSPARLAWLAALERLLAGEGVGPLLEQARNGLAFDELARLCGQAPERIGLPASARRIETASGPFALLREPAQALRGRLLAALRDFHATHPDDAGVDAGRLRRLVDPSIDAALWHVLVEEAVAEAALQRTGPWLHLPTHHVEPTAEEQALLAKLLPRVVEGGSDPPWVRDHAASLGADEALVRSALRKSAARGEVMQVVRDLFYARECIDGLVAVLRELASRHGAVEAAHWRDALGIGRKRAIQILEFFDRVGYTRRVRDTHVLRGDGEFP